jgi:hypothetical protein
MSPSLSLLREAPSIEAANPRRQGDEGKAVTTSRSFFESRMNRGSSLRILNSYVCWMTLKLGVLIPC